MKILQVTPLYLPVDGGAERHVQIVSERLAARGHDVTVLTLNVESDYGLYHRIAGSLPEDELVNGVRVRRLSPRTGLATAFLDGLLRLPGGHRLSRTLLGAEALEMLLRFPRNLGAVRFLLANTFDVVSTWNWHWPLAYHAHLARRLRAFPLVGVPLFHTAQEWSRRRIYEPMLESCTGVIVNTAHEEEFIVGRTRRTPPILVAGVGIEPTQFEAADGRAFRAEHGLGDAPVVGYVGRLIPSKGADRVVAAMAEVWRWRDDVQLLVAGQQANPYPELDRALESMSKQRRGQVLLLPDFAEADKADLLDAIDLLALPSVGESFGIAYLEAWCRGKPVIGSRIASTACVIDDGRDGLLVDPHDPVDIGRAMIRMLDDRQWAEELGRRGRAKALERHTWQQVVDRIEDFYRDVAAGHHSRASRS